MPVEVVKVVFSFPIESRVSAVQREGAGVEVTISVSLRHEGKIVGALFVHGTDVTVPLGIRIANQVSSFLNLRLGRSWCDSWVDLSVLKGGWLVHIKPKAIIREDAIKVSQTLSPHVHALVIEPVDKDCSLRPDFLNQVAAIRSIVSIKR